MLQELEAQKRVHYAGATCPSVLVVGLLFGLMCVVMAMRAQHPMGVADVPYLLGGVMAVLAMALGRWVGWRWAAHLLAVSMFGTLVLLSLWADVAPSFFLTHLLVLVTFACWALGRRMAIFWAIAAMMLVLFAHSLEHMLWLHVWVLAYGLLAVLCAVLEMRSSAMRHIEALTQVVRQQQEQNSHLTLLSHAIEQTADSIAIVDFDGRVVYANKAFERQSGYQQTEAVGKYAREISSTGLSPELRAQMRSTVEQGKVWRSVLHNRRKDDRQVIESVSISPVLDAAGEVTHFIECKHDMSAQLANEQRIAQLQNLDELTQLRNRSALLRGIDNLLLQQRLQRRGDLPSLEPWHGLLLVDVDRFSLFNDARGSAWGDQLVLALAQRLQAHLPAHGWMARVMADRFAIVLEHVGSNSLAARHAVQHTAMLLQAQLRDVVCQGEVVPISCGLGYTLFTAPEDVDGAGSSSHILRRATLALQQAKRQGSGQTYAYTEALTQSAVRKLHIETGLHQALQEEQLQLYVQPQVASSGRVVGVEALLRWQHPQEGWISPGEFIPVAEEAGLIIPLGDWVLEQVCQVLQQPAVQAGGYSVSANISALQIMQNDFVPKLERLIARTGIAANKLLLEVTEGTLLNDVGTTVEKMQALQALGVQFALDDFGTGYSSLAYVMQLPIQELKLDQSFIRELDSQGVSGALVEGVLMVAQRKGVRVVAEGVERAEQAELLHAWDPSLLCQGYFFSRPVPVEQWMANPQTHSQQCLD